MAQSRFLKLIPRAVASILTPAAQSFGAGGANEI
jgi:hypothetical protein